MAEFELPTGWLAQVTVDCFEQVSTNNSSVKAKDCMATGQFPVIDQGQSFIAGYTDDSSKVVKLDSPIVVFGDHTRVVKWVDFDFVPGADGTKLLKPQNYLHPRFFFHQFKSLDIPDKGYARHFKHLRELQFLVPPVAEQKVIADKLDTLLAQVETTKACLERIPEILKSFRQSVLAAAVTGKLTEEWRFITKSSLTLESFNKSLSYFRAKAKGLDRISENGSWISCQLGHVISVKSGDGLTAKDMAPEGYIPVYGGNGINGYHNKSNVSDSVIAIGRVGFYCGSVHLTEKQAWITDNALIVDFSEQLFSKDFLYFLLRATNLREDSASTAQPVISGAKIYPISVKIPPFEEQTEIVRRVEQLFAFADSIEQKANAALARVNNLTQSILAKAFRGELTADWRAANPELITGDNSAEALLAKIKADRAKLAKKTKAKVD